MRMEHIDVDEVAHNGYTKEKGRPQRNKEEKDEATSALINTIVEKMKEKRGKRCKLRTDGSVKIPGVRVGRSKRREEPDK